VLLVLFVTLALLL
jgi:hypothetical protein